MIKIVDLIKKYFQSEDFAGLSSYFAGLSSYNKYKIIKNAKYGKYRAWPNLHTKFHLTISPYKLLEYLIKNNIKTLKIKNSITNNKSKLTRNGFKILLECIIVMDLKNNNIIFYSLDKKIDDFISNDEQLQNFIEEKKIEFVVNKL